MNRKQLALQIAKREAGKKQVSIAQITEIIRILCELIQENESVLKVLTRKKK